jgi:hypothetical protein
MTATMAATAMAIWLGFRAVLSLGDGKVVGRDPARRDLGAVVHYRGAP